LVRLDRPDGLELKVVQREGIACTEAFDQVHPFHGIMRPAAGPSASRETPGSTGGAYARRHGRSRIDAMAIHRAVLADEDYLTS
jgi:hypothetical protein